MKTYACKIAMVISKNITEKITKHIGNTSINCELINLLQPINFHAKPTKIFIKICPETILANNLIDKLKILDK